MVGFSLDAWLAEQRRAVDALMDAALPALAPDADPGRLVEAMRYSLLAPGKRLRPVLALAAAQAIGAPLDENVRAAAAAVELVHCYSLIHDDLPAMDDDDFRRGRPTSHKVFGEAIAILAGDALLTLAFEWIAVAGARAAETTGSRAARAYLQASAALARGAGAAGMVRGQARDLTGPAPQTLAAAEGLHHEKTGALFRAALEVGAAVALATPDQAAMLGRFGESYGVAFQHADDLADKEHVELSALAHTRLQELTQRAAAQVAMFGDRAEPLRALAHALAHTHPYAPTSTAPAV